MTNEKVELMASLDHRCTGTKSIYIGALLPKLRLLVHAV